MANRLLQKQPQRSTLGNVVVLSGTTSLSALGYGKLTIQASKEIAVPEREKEWLWRELKKNFTVPAESEEAAKRWTLSKMGEQLQTFKKNLTKNYIKKGKMPEFTGDLAKQKDHWNAFVAYKS